MCPGLRAFRWYSVFRSSCSREVAGVRTNEPTFEYSVCIHGRNCGLGSGRMAKAQAQRWPGVELSCRFHCPSCWLSSGVGRIYLLQRDRAFSSWKLALAMISAAEEMDQDEEGVGALSARRGRADAPEPTETRCDGIGCHATPQ